MLKVLAAVLAVLSAAISITIYTATLPAVQKQAADNAAAIEQNAEAIETLGGSVSDNTEAIETLNGKKIYRHDISITNNDNAYIYITTFSENSSQINTYDKFINNLTKSHQTGQFSQNINAGGHIGDYLIKYFLIRNQGSGVTITVGYYNTYLSITNSFVFSDTVNEI